MKNVPVTKAVTFWLDYHRSNSREATVKSYSTIFNKFCLEFGERNLYELTSDEILSFLNRITENRKPQTKKTRYAHLSSFFNFIRNNIDENFRNPCDSPMMRKQFKAKTADHWDIIEKEKVDEVIFRTLKSRNRLLLELMARGGMRIGEVLKLTPNDIKYEKLALRDPKSGKEIECVFIPKKLSDRLMEYIRENKFEI